MFNQQPIFFFGQIQTSQTVGQLYSDTSPYKVSVLWSKMFLVVGSCSEKPFYDPEQSL